MSTQKIIVLSNFTSEPLQSSLDFWLQKLSLPHTIEFAPYNQIFQQLLQPTSQLFNNQKGLNVILVRLDDWDVSADSPVLQVSQAEKERLFNGGAPYTLPNHQEIAHLNSYETDYLFQEIFNNKAYLRHGITLNKGDCVIDIGANIGLFSLFIQQICPTATVYAFEPSPPAFEALAVNAQLYGRQMHVFNYGLSNENKELEFTFYRQSSVFSGYYADDTQDEVAVRAVIKNALQKTATLTPEMTEKLTDELVADRLNGESIICQSRPLSGIIREQKIEQIDLLKIDAEKSELDILKGIDSDHWPLIKQIVMEVHDSEGDVMAEIYRLLKSNGFVLTVDEENLLQNSGLYNIYARRRPHQNQEQPIEMSFAGDKGAVLDTTSPYEQNIQELGLALRQATERSLGPLLLCLCPPATATRMNPLRLTQFNQAVTSMVSSLTDVPGLQVITPSLLHQLYPLPPEAIHDTYSDQAGHIPYTPVYFATLGTMIVRKLYRLQKLSAKVIVLDCDQTLWAGVCAEDGPLNVQVDGPWQALQAFMVTQSEAGRLICLCSKNNEADVMAVFDQQSDMALQRRHLVAWRINWKAKSENLRSLAQELQLGLDSFIFIDDNPLECAEVQANCPDVLTLNLPSDPEKIPQFLSHIWALDQNPTTAVDRQRTRLYQQNRQREIVRHQSLTYADFLTGLELNVEISAMEPAQLARVAQLTQRVNQFNASTRPRSEAEIKQGSQVGDFEVQTVKVKDRFGNYGFVGLMLFTPYENRLLVDTLLLSCRALGRGVEHQMLAYLGKLANEQGLPWVDLPYYPTDRNQPVLEFLNSVSADSTKPLEGGLCFRFLSEKITKLTFNPPHKLLNNKDDRQKNHASHVELGRQSTADLVHRSDLLHQIATELYSPDQILKAVAHNQRQQRNSQPDQSFVPPQTEVEKTLAKLWANILNLDQVGITDNFLVLGGNSLQGVQLISGIHHQFEVALSLQDLFDNPTIANLSQVLADGRQVEKDEALLTPIRPRTNSDQALDPNIQALPPPAPLSFAQQRLWFLDRLQPGNPAYNIFFPIRLSGTLNIAALSQALAKIVQRHEILRTTVTTIDGQPKQVAHPVDTLEFTLDNLRQPGLLDNLRTLSTSKGEASRSIVCLRRDLQSDLPRPYATCKFEKDTNLPPPRRHKIFDLPVLDLSCKAEEERQVRLNRLALAEARYPFDLAKEALLRPILFKWQDKPDPVYILFLTMQHIISDRWSMRLFFQELSAIYQGIVTDRPVDLPDLPIQYADFAAWQRHWWTTGNDRIKVLQNYWQQLDKLPTLQLPTDQPRPPAQTFAGAIHIFTVPDPLANDIRYLSQQAGTTLFMTLLAAFSTLLYRYTNQPDIPLGTPIANRSRSELSNLIGFFVNTLLLRLDLAKNPTFLELLARVRQTTLDSYTHQDLPFDQLVEIIQPERDPSRSPLFQIMFSLQNTPPLQALNLRDVSTDLLPIDPGISQFDLSLEMIEETEGLTGIFEYNTDLFEAATIERMAGHFQTLLTNIIVDPGQRVSQINLLTASERQKLLEWNNLPSTFSMTCVQDLFEHRVQQAPDAVAVILPSDQSQPLTHLNCKSLTYRALNEQANQLAHYLHNLGVGLGVMVGLFVDRSLEMVIGLMGILKAGAAYVPLDTAYPPDRLTFMLSDTNMPVVVTQSYLSPLLPLDDSHQELAVVCIDTDWPEIALYPQTSPLHRATSESLAYVMYTSGSTGRPKGVMIEHRALSWYAQTAAEAYQITAGDRVLQFSSISFDISVEEIFPTLTQGAALLLRTESMLSSMTEFLHICTDLEVTALFLPTAFWHDLAARLADDPLMLPPSLRLLSFGGEKVRPERVSGWHKQIGDQVQLWNGYGPTETTVVAALYQLSGRAAWQASSIGQAISGAKLYILDEQLQPAPVGVPGELYIGGAGVARGYLNQPGLTAERFIPNPFNYFGLDSDKVTLNPKSKTCTERPTDGVGNRSTQSLTSNTVKGSKLYKTGDLARYRTDGQIEYLGRLDQQVKVRGFRVELGEVETLLACHPKIQEAAVLTHVDQFDRTLLVAYLVLRQDNLMTPLNAPRSLGHPWSANGRPQFLMDIKHQLHDYLKDKLPGYMIPSHFTVLETLPLTPNGKVDRRALPHPEVDLDNTYVGPRNEIEELLVRVWEQILPVERVGVYDNFFALGGDSILSIQIVARANQAGLRLTPRQMFAHQTIAALANVVDTATMPLTEQGLITGAVPLTPIQHWFFEQQFTKPDHWNMSLLLEIDAPLNLQHLILAWQSLAQHHDALRLHFAIDGSSTRWRQFNAGIGRNNQDLAPFISIDLSGLPQDKQETSIQHTATALQTGLNLSKGPLICIALFQFGSHRSAQMLIVAHHLIIDGVSWRILLEDLRTAYRHLDRQKLPQLPAKTTAFKQWAEQLESYARSETLRKELPYWLASSQKITRLPIDYPVPARNELSNTEGAAHTISTHLTPTETRALLHQLPTIYQTHIDEILITALAQTLAQWVFEATPGKKNNEISLLIDLEGHGREDVVPDVDLSRTVGWFTTIYPVLLTLNRAQSPCEAVKFIQQQLRQVPQRGIGYGILRYLAADQSVKDQLRAQPQAEVSFNYLGQFDRQQSLLNKHSDSAANELQWAIKSLFQGMTGPVRSLREQRSHLLDINGYITSGKLYVEWTYSGNLHQKSTIECQARCFIKFLQSLIDTAKTVHLPISADFPVDQSDLSILEQLTDRYQSVEDIYPLSPMQQLMLNQTLQSPDSSAYHVQWYCTIRGNLNIDAFQHAWQQVVDRHPALRTTFVWSKLSQPFQMVAQQARLPWTQLDWQSMLPEEQQAHFIALLQKESSRGIDLTNGPLMYLMLIQIAPKTYYFVWSHHHLLLDGWSTQSLWQDVATYYQLACKRQVAPTVTGPQLYRHYIAHLASAQDIGARLLELKGVAYEAGLHTHQMTPNSFLNSSLGTRLGFTGVEQTKDAPSGLIPTYDRQRIYLSDVTTQRLQTLAHRHYLTLNTIIQGAWVMVLAAFFRQKMIKLGVVISDRPPDLGGVEAIVGLLLKIVPGYVPISSNENLIPWLVQLQAQQAELRDREDLVAIDNDSFEAIIRFQNYPIDGNWGQKLGADLQISDIDWVDYWPYPLSIEIIPAREMLVQLSYDKSRFNGDVIGQLLAGFQALVDAFFSETDQTLGELLDTTLSGQPFT